MIKSSFFEFNVATTALFTAQANMQIKSHNIANASTQGYSRQYGETVTYRPMAGNGIGMFGTGSYVKSIKQHRSFFLDQRFWQNQSLLGENAVKANKNEALQKVMDELGDTGVNSNINDLFDTLQDLSTNTGDLTFRNNFISSASTLAEQIKSIGLSLEEYQKDTNQEIYSMIETINSLGRQIVTLNEQIKSYEFNGDNANDLRDKRALLVDELSQYVNVDIKETQRNPDYDPNDPYSGFTDLSFKVEINGYDFVNGDKLNPLIAQERHVAVVDRINEIARKIDNDGATQDLLDELATYGNFEIDAATNKLKFLGDPSTTDDDRILDSNNELVHTPIPYLNKESYMRNPNDVEGLYDIYFSNPKQKFPMFDTSLKGELKGLIDIRDGNNGRHSSLSYGGKNGNNMFGEKYSQTTAYKGIPHYLEKLNNLVRTFAMSFNEGINFSGENIKDFDGHVNGYDLDGNTGNFLFSYVDPDTGKTVNTTNNAVKDFELANGNETHLDYSKLTYENFAVNDEIVLEPKKLSLGSSATSDISDNTLVLSMLELKTDISLFAEGNMTDFVVSMTTELGIDGKKANNFATNYADTVIMVDNQRLEVSGVDMNEEMADIVKYQQMYQSAAKLINVIDLVYDTCINRLGNF